MEERNEVKPVYRRLIRYYQRRLGIGGVLSNTYPFYCPCHNDKDARKYLRRLANEAAQKTPFDWGSISPENEYDK